MYATWRTEFEAWPVPAELIEAVAAGRYRDCSWHNDAAPSFTVTAAYALREDIRLYADAIDPASRECDFGGRYVVSESDAYGHELRSTATDNLIEAMHTLEAWCALRLAEYA